MIGHQAPRLTVLAAAAPPTLDGVAATPLGNAPLATDPLAPAASAPTIELDLAALLSKVVWITFYSAEC